MATTIQTSSLTNSIAMKLLLELQRYTHNSGFGDAYLVVRAHAQEIVETFTGAMLGGWADDTVRTLPDRPRSPDATDQIVWKLIRDLHRQTAALARYGYVDVAADIYPHVQGLVAAFKSDWPHCTDALPH